MPGGTPPNDMPGPGPLPWMQEVVLPDKDFDNMSLDWNQYQNQWERSEDGSFYTLKFVFYCRNVLVPKHQYMNIYVPAAYLNDDGTVNKCGICRKYTAKTAPIVFQNNCGGWNSSIPMGVNQRNIQEGFVHVEVGARSRDLADGLGKAPSACVDQKAAVRMLRLHDSHIPGDKEKIISCGGSGGGQMSSILGATGNMADYYPALWEIGAPGIEKQADGSYISTIRDDIYASQCYCPIVDLDNYDLGYSWMRYDTEESGYSDFMSGTSMTFTPFQMALQTDMAKAFAGYINSLQLQSLQGQPLSFAEGADGSWNLRGGSYYTQILQNISDALNAFLEDKLQPDGSLAFEKQNGPFQKEQCSYPSVEKYFSSFRQTDEWLKHDENGSWMVTDLAAFLKGTGLARNKGIPSVDTFCCDEKTGHHGNAFGTAAEGGVHFSRHLAELIDANLGKYRSMKGFEACDAESYHELLSRKDIQRQTHLMNATHILLGKVRGMECPDIAKHWRTRNGTADEHISFTAAYNLCLAANMAGAESVDYAMVWAAPHGDVDGDGTGSFIAWVHKICS